MDSYFYNRSSCRIFSDREVSVSKIKEMLEAASHAPTTGNMQLYSVIITTDPVKKAALAPAHFSQPAYMNAPVIITFCADFNRFVKWCEVSDATPGYDNVQSFIAAALDTTILAQQFVTIAEMEGFGTCYLGTTTYNPDKIADVLNLPALVVPIITVSLGYRNEQSKVSDRLSVDSFVHEEVYSPYSAEQIKEFYKEKEGLEESRGFVKENGKDTLAQVFTDVRYPKANNEYFSKVFVDFLKKSGFAEGQKG